MATNSLTKTFTSTFVPGTTVVTNVWVTTQPVPISALGSTAAASTALPAYWNGVYGVPGSQTTSLFTLEAGVKL